MQACKNTYDKKTNKVANELNKLGIGKKNKIQLQERQHSPGERQISRCMSGCGEQRERGVKKKKKLLRWALSNKESEKCFYNIHIK